MMTKSEAIKIVLEIGIIPVVRAESEAQAMAAAVAVCAGGVPIVEVTMTVPGAVKVIAQLSKSMGQEVLIGAGTVLDSEDARRCLDAGAQFLVSPALDLETVKLAQQAGVMVMPGALTPNELLAAWKAGADFVKVFPCGSVGGPKYIKALKAPFPQIPMIPTGGVNLNTAADFIQAGAAALGIGGELVSIAALRSGNTQEITTATRRYVEIVREARNGKSIAASTVVR
jgi:2-dehydro-3-deoxyphosphogluconate aldolase/(4S)-4-hydroxy-2-oxoglutarate aldolase